MFRPHLRRSAPAIVGRVVVALACASTLLAQPASAATQSSQAAGPHLQVQRHTPSHVAGFRQFTYQTGTTTGLAAEVARTIDRSLAVLVQRTVDAAQKPKGTWCGTGAARCGAFIQSLRSHPCLPGSLCITQQVGLQPQGANDTEAWVDAAVYSTVTGARQHLADFVPAAKQASFVAAVNTQVSKALVDGGIVNDPYWSDPVTLDDIHSWQPTPQGMHVWFAKYGVAPGSFGIVHVLIPWSAITG